MITRLVSFCRLFHWFSLRHAWRYRKRTVAVLLGIGLGAAVFTGVRLAARASVDAFSRSMGAVVGKADRSLVRPGGRIPERLVSRLLKLAPVRTAAPLISCYVQREGDEDESFRLIGLDPILDRGLRTMTVGGRHHGHETRRRPWLELIRRPHTLLLSSKLAEHWKVRVGDPIDLRYLNGAAPFTVVGILGARGLALVDGGYAAVADISTVQEFIGCCGRVDRIDLRFWNRDSKAALRLIRKCLPPGVVMVSPGTAKAGGERMIRAYQLNLSILSFVSLFVGMFLVYSLVALNGAARRREVAIIRSLGGSKAIPFALFMGEGALLGCCGWIMAIPLGMVMVHTLLRGVGKTVSLLFSPVRVDTLPLSVPEIALSLLVTLGVSLAAAYRPARDAMRVTPREALEIVSEGDGDAPSTPRQKALAALLIGSVWPLCRLPAWHAVPVFAYLAILNLFTGFALAAPAALRAFAFKAALRLRQWAGEPAYLAARYLREADACTAVSLGALTTAVALFVALVVMVTSFRTTVVTWVDQAVAGDLFVRGMLAGENEYRDPLPEAVVAGLKRLRGSVDILPYRRIFLHYRDLPFQFEPLDLEVFFKYGGFLILEGSRSEIRDRMLHDDGVVISQVFAARSGLQPGDRLALVVSGVSLRLPIVGIVRDYRTRGGVAFFSRKRYRQLTGDERWGGARLFLKDRTGDLDARRESLRQRVIRCCAANVNLEITSGPELRQEILHIFDETFAVTSVLLLIALLIAGLGITTTLTVQVLQRSVQLNTLLALGASRNQIRRMIFWEAALITVTGIAVGIACGFLLSLILIYVVNRQSFGWTFLYQVDWKTLAATLPLILAASLGAVFPAGRMAFRSSPASLLRRG